MYAQTAEDPRTQLCSLFLRYGSDKCPQVFHSYSELYFEMLKDRRFEYRNIMEIGIGSMEVMSPIVGEKYTVGASLRAWRDFFPNARVYGLDIDRNILFSDERITCLYADQSDPESLENAVKEIHGSTPFPGFDLIVDDGSHSIQDMQSSFTVLFKHMNRGGIYIIEDIKAVEMDVFESMDLQGGRLLLSFPGKTEWDGFIAVQKT
jgi:hypothetical protein